jgi:hypothetical protein
MGAKGVGVDPIQTTARKPDRYLDQYQTEKIETEVKDVDRIRITKVYVSCPGVAFWGVIRALQSDINICYNPPSLHLPTNK